MSWSLKGWEFVIPSHVGMIDLINCIKEIVGKPLLTKTKLIGLKETC